MAERVVVACPADVWTKVATGVQNGVINVKNLGPVYLNDYRLTTNPPPPNNDTATLMPLKGTEISFTESVDIYIKCLGVPGEVIVSL